MLGLAIAAGWVATGAVAVALMRRRGHDAFSWAVLFLFLGPIAVPLAISSDRHRPAEPPRPLPPAGSTCSSPTMGRPTRRPRWRRHWPSSASR